MKNNIYNFTVTEFSGKERSLRDFDGKVLLIVNTASKCYFARQFKPLEKLYQKYKDFGFEVLAFPSNNFNNQEPRTGKNLEIFCRVNQMVTFPVFRRTHVRGEHVHPLFSFLSNKELNGVLNSKPVWNFHKYLINKKGEVVDFFYPFTSPTSTRIASKIESLLKQ